MAAHEETDRRFPTPNVRSQECVRRWQILRRFATQYASLETPSRTSVRTAHPRNRRGMALLLALLCLTVSASLMANMAKTIRLDRQKRTVREQALQTTWLARHGLAIASQRVADNNAKNNNAKNDGDYEGDTWQLVVPNEPNQRIGDIAVSAKRANETNDDLALVVTAKYPFGQVDQSTKTLTAIIPVESNESAPE